MTNHEFPVQVKSLVTGETVHFKMEGAETLKATLDKAYAELNEKPRQGDTFRCANGADLTDRLHETIDQLKISGICVDEHFEIRGPSGGARAVA